jgi:tRNA pseudouridine38-40 synthase
VPSFRLTLEYDGRDFAGWQIQAGGQRTVQGTLEEALRRVTGEAVRATGAGRTDAGVHAEAQVVSVALETTLSPERLRRALNGVLPPDLAVRGCDPAPPGFHARYRARSKLYRYRIWNGESRSPLREARWVWVPSALDLGAMRRGASALLGTHDFAAFQAAGSPVRSSVRTLHRLDVEGQPRGEIEVWVEGDGFLRHMVRILAGTLLEVGLGRRDAAGLSAVLAARDRHRAGRTAPARGLALVRISY